MKKRLITKEKLVNWGKLDTTTCVFCNEEDETLDHLFFNYDYSYMVWSIILDACGRHYTDQNWMDYVERITHEWKEKSLKNNLCKASLASTIYHLWIERNNSIFSCTSSTKEVLVAKVKKDIRDKVLEASKVAHLSENHWLTSTSLLPCCIFKEKRIGDPQVV